MTLTLATVNGIPVGRTTSNANNANAFPRFGNVTDDLLDSSPEALAVEKQDLVYSGLPKDLTASDLNLILELYEMAESTYPLIYFYNEAAKTVISIFYNGKLNHQSLGKTLYCKKEIRSKLLEAWSEMNEMKDKKQLH
ncbi:MAG: hypothetical protein PHE25_02195 [Candidatus Gracilibacteria bacterium]|nr:hypothetical protein [Candidatus Gracilibacteria bacterium]